MYARSRYHDSEFVKWSVILFLGAMLTLALASALGAADIPASSSRLERFPPSMVVPSRPPWMDSQKQDLGTKVWHILGLHSEKKYGDALRAWNQINVPAESRVWKDIAIGQAAIATKELVSAEQALAEAEGLQPDNPIVHYFLGILRLEQASTAVEWPEYFPSRIRFVSSPTSPIVPNTKSMYILTATIELEKAILHAGSVHLDEALIPPSLSTYVALEPTVGDLLLALGAENFEARAHNTLGSLFLERGSLEIAEEHMDAAMQKGMANVFGFEDLADAYCERGQFVDAARANLKAMAHGHHKVDSALDALRNLGDALQLQIERSGTK